MIVDDSAVIRGLLSRILTAEPGIVVAASVANGEIALGTLSRQEIDVVILDIDLPDGNGLELVGLCLLGLTR